MHSNNDFHEQHHLRILIEQLVREGRTQAQIERALAEATGADERAFAAVSPALSFFRRAASRLGRGEHAAA